MTLDLVARPGQGLRDGLHPQGEPAGGAEDLGGLALKLRLGEPVRHVGADEREGAIGEEVGGEGLRIGVADVVVGLAAGVGGADARAAFLLAFRRHAGLQRGGQADAARLKVILAPFPGTAAVRIQYRNAKASCELVLGPSYRVSLDDGLLKELHDWLSPENVEIVYG